MTADDQTTQCGIPLDVPGWFCNQPVGHKGLCYFEFASVASTAEERSQRALPPVGYERLFQSLRSAVEDCDIKAEKLTDADGWIKVYQLSCGPWHRVLAAARAGLTSLEMDGRCVCDPPPPTATSTRCGVCGGMMLV